VYKNTADEQKDSCCSPHNAFTQKCSFNNKKMFHRCTYHCFSFLPCLSSLTHSPLLPYFFVPSTHMLCNAFQQFITMRLFLEMLPFQIINKFLPFFLNCFLIFIFFRNKQHLFGKSRWNREGCNDW
jgi:hypothetical protein